MRVFNELNKTECFFKKQARRRRMSHVKPNIWRGMAGPLAQLPMVNSIVLYFPRGHLEESNSPTHHLRRLINNNNIPQCILCTITSVDLLASPLNDVVFTRLSLQPSSGITPLIPFSLPQEDKIVSFAKTLFPNEVFPFVHLEYAHCSIPDSVADSIFPQIPVTKDHQNLILKDIHGKEWKFVHHHRSFFSLLHTFSSHAICEGWAEFAIQKRLIAGDSIVFMKNSKGEIIIGIRRIQKLLFDESVENNIRLATTLFDFQVVYAPSTYAGWSDFVVRVEDVQRAMKVNWNPGKRVMMPVLWDNPTGLKWFPGTIYSRNLLDRGFVWRMLQIKWDLNEEWLMAIEWVNPWQLVLAASMHSLM